MKKIFLILALTSCMLSSKAQVMFDDFESNQYGWTETTQRGGTAIIKDGVMRLECGMMGMGSIDIGVVGVHTTCYAPFDYNKPFTMSVDVIADKIGSWPYFGILLDYEDDNNFIILTILRESTILKRIQHGRIVAEKWEDIKMSRGKDVGFKFEVEYNLNELVFRINDVKALSYRRRLPYGEYLLGTSGIGFFAGAKQKISFDNLKIDQ